MGTSADKKGKMKAGIYDPYLDTLGGGERYIMTVAYCLAKNGWKVDVFWDDKAIKRRIQDRLGIKIERVNFVPDIFKKAGIIRKWQFLKKYDLIFYLSDGSIPFLFGKKNILHFQVPFHDIGGRNLLNKIKLKKMITDIVKLKDLPKEIDKCFNNQSLKMIVEP